MSFSGESRCVTTRQLSNIHTPSSFFLLAGWCRRVHSERPGPSLPRVGRRPTSHVIDPGRRSPSVLMKASSLGSSAAAAARAGARAAREAAPLSPHLMALESGGSAGDLVPLFLAGSPVMAALLDRIERWAPQKDAILLRGAQGVGKTLLAQYIHERSGRTGAFACESASGVQGSLLKAELFGFARHSFTGANEAREGLLETANGGTFFLDELGDSDAELQGLLVHFMDRKAIRRLGERRLRPLNVRFIAATNADLEEQISRREFRSDLLARFGKLILRIPSLAERREEIVPLARGFLERISLEFKLPVPLMFSARVERILRNAPWPMNVRELLATCRYAAMEVGRTSRIIEERHLPADVLASVPLKTFETDTGAMAAVCRAALVRSGGNKAAAARAMGISRQYFYKLLQRHEG